MMESAEEEIKHHTLSSTSCLKRFRSFFFFFFSPVLLSVFIKVHPLPLIEDVGDFDVELFCELARKAFASPSTNGSAIMVIAGF